MLSSQLAFEQLHPTLAAPNWHSFLDLAQNLHGTAKFDSIKANNSIRPPDLATFLAQSKATQRQYKRLAYAPTSTNAPTSSNKPPTLSPSSKWTGHTRQTPQNFGTWPSAST
jgi:hypothetical protein